MELNEMRSLWQSYELKLEKALNLNVRCLNEIQTQKAKSALAPLTWNRVIEMAFHGISIVLLVIFSTYHWSQPPLAISALALILFYGLAFTNSLNQFKAIRQVNRLHDVVSVQSALARIQTYKLNFARMSILLIPMLLAFPVVVPAFLADLNIHVLDGFDIIRETNGKWWTIQIITLVSMIPLFAWFYHETTYKNVHKKWVSDFITRTAGSRVKRAMEYINELETLKAEL